MLLTNIFRRRRCWKMLKWWICRHVLWENDVFPSYEPPFNGGFPMVFPYFWMEIPQPATFDDRRVILLYIPLFISPVHSHSDEWIPMIFLWTMFMVHCQIHHTSSSFPRFSHDFPMIFPWSPHDPRGVFLFQRASDVFIAPPCETRSCLGPTSWTSTASSCAAEPRIVGGRRNAADGRRGFKSVVTWNNCSVQNPFGWVIRPKI